MSTQVSAIQSLAEQANLEGHNVSGTLAISLKDKEVIYTQKIEDPSTTAETCLDIWNSSVKLKSLQKSSEDDSKVQLVRVRSEDSELFLVSAEQSLRAGENQPGFAILLLHVVASNNFDLNTRLAGALFFKNFINRKWTDEEGNYLLAQQDVVSLKQEIIGLMISLPSSLRVQMGEAVSIIADSDFPDKWENLVPELVSRLGQDIKVNNGVLQVAHSIFKRWRPLFRSDALFLEIKLVLGQFSVPFLQALKETDSMIEQSAGDKEKLNDLFNCLHVLVKIYFDLNCQDIPEFFEDNLDACMEIFHKYLNYSNPLLDSDNEDEPSIIELVKSSIYQVLELFTQRYEDVFGRLLPNFVQTTWNMLTSVGLQPRYDLLVSKSLGFLTSVAKVQQNVNNIFGDDEILDQIIKNIILPNITLTSNYEELFEDDPIEYTRRDLEGSDSDTRRRAATDLVRELSVKLEAKVTSICMTYINGYLQNYNSNKEENWRSKDTATYLFSAIAAKANITSAGVSSTNLLLDIVGFFQENIAPDLIVSGDKIHPILKVDAIKYIHTFRNQLTKEQLISAFPLLSSLLSSSTDYVVYTYAAVTIERILSIRNSSNSGLLMFQKNDISPVAKDLLTNLFRLIRNGNTTPEKLAENEFLMKCIMRILITSQDSSASYGETLVVELISLVIEISKNPSNPKFSHYTFEAIGSIIRFDGAIIGPEKLESIILEPFLQILGQDVAEFVPYVFQILSQLLNIKRSTSGLPEVYQSLIKPLLSPALWESRGNVPALVGLLEAILSKGNHLIIQTNSLEPLLGVFQKLVASKINDSFGFDLLEKIFLYIPVESLAPYTKQMAIILLQRLKTGKTDKYVARFSNFIYYLSAVENKPGLGPIFAVDFVDAAQPGLFPQILEQFILLATLQIKGFNARKMAAIGLTKIIMQNPKFIEGTYSTQWLPAVETLIKLLKTVVAEPLADSEALDMELDLDEISFGATFAKLATTSTHPFDPAPSIKDPSEFFISELRRLSGQYHGPVYQLIGQLPDESKRYLNQLGFS